MKCSLIDQHVKKQSRHGMSTFNRSSVYVDVVILCMMRGVKNNNLSSYKGS